MTVATTITAPTLIATAWITTTTATTMATATTTTMATKTTTTTAILLPQKLGSFFSSWVLILLTYRPKFILTKSD